METTAQRIVEAVRRTGTGRGDLVAVVVAPEVGMAVATSEGSVAVPGGSSAWAAVLAAVEDVARPRWVLWGATTAADLVAAGVRVATCWDVSAVERLHVGGWRVDAAAMWARLHDLDPGTAPTPGPLDLFNHADRETGDPEHPVRPDGHIRPEWLTGGWASGTVRLGRWGQVALEIARLQGARLADKPGRLRTTARAESTAELLCAELAADGLPVDRHRIEHILSSIIGPRPRTPKEAQAQRAARDAAVLRHLPHGVAVDLRSPGQVTSLLQRLGVEVTDSRAWRLRAVRDSHPVVPALLEWRKAERIATTYNYSWLDERLGPDGRLRGAWAASDGAAGRMTATAGLHNLPAELRGAVVAEPGHVFVRADLGQIEPRVLAAVSADPVLAGATLADDMYAPVATQLGVDRATAKVAVLGAMYGQTTGHGAQALRQLRTTYPVAMGYLDDADRAGQAGHPLRTFGGRCITMGAPDDPATPGRAAARGRYGRNAMVQGAAAELFKQWAVTVRARLPALDAQIVLCLHDELLVQAPAEQGAATAALLDHCLQEASARWAGTSSVRFTADIAVVASWSDAKVSAEAAAI